MSIWRRISTSRWIMMGYGLILLFVVIGLYANTIKYPHVQDDWRVINFVTFNDTGKALQSFFDPGDHMFYRPLSMTYHLVMTRLFGANAIPFHLVDILLMFLNSWLVAVVVGRLMKDRFLGMLTGILYASATSIHIVPLLWAVGINELAGMCCFLLSVWFFDREKYPAAAGFCLLGLLFKEAVWFLPVFLLVLLIRKGGYSSFSGFLKKAVSALWLVALVSGVYLFAKSYTVWPVSLPEGHPYAAAIGPLVVARNLLLYLRWMMEALIPPLIGAESWATLMIWLERHLRWFLLLLVLFSAAAYALLAADTKRNREENILSEGPARPVFSNLVFLGIWFFLGIAAPLCLRGHHFRYYLIYSLIPFLFFTVWFVRALARRVMRDPRHVAFLLILLTALNVFFSARFIHGREARGLAEKPLEGNGRWYRNGAVVHMIHRDLLRLRPDIPAGAVVVIGGVDLWPIRQADAIQVWYSDRSLNVYPLHRVLMEKGSLKGKPRVPWVQRNHPPPPVPLDPETTFFFRVEDDRLVEFTDEVQAFVGEITSDE